MTGRTYRIFVSSPSDVRPERAVAERTIRKLSRDFAHHCALVPVLWEQEPLLASQHFQDAGNIPSAGATDVCIVVLWSRLGFALPADSFRGVISGREVTGTEYEFEDALKNCRERGLPDLLVYQKTADVVASLADETMLRELLHQKRLVGDFFDRWFKCPDGGSFTAASHGFATAADFETLLEAHLRTLLLRRLQRDMDLSAESGAVSWSGPPWPALAAFDLAQAPIFFGRGRACREVREALAAGIGAGTAFVLVVGASGSGKSSLVRAGLLPDLMLPGMLGDTGLVRYGTMRPSDSGGDGMRALADTLLCATALPELAELAYAADTLAAQLRQTPGQAAFAVRQGLGQAASGKLTARGQARLVLVVDQMEELFTVAQMSRQERDSFVGALAALAKSGLVWVIGTMRADFFGQLGNLSGLAELANGRTYLLLPPNAAELTEIVGKPARAAGLRFEADPATGQRLDEVIVAAAARDPGALPLLSFALDALWRRPRDGGELRYSAYADLGSLEGAISTHAETIVEALPPAALAVLPELLLGLVTTGEGETLAAARVAHRAELAHSPAASLALERLIEARLLIADETRQGATVRLAHEALLRTWPRLTALIEESRDLLAVMARLREDMGRWIAGGRHADLLLPPGRRLTEGMELLSRPDGTPDGELTGFIRASVTAASTARRRRQRVVLGAFCALTVLTSAALLGAWFGLSGRFAAEASRNALREQYEIAETRRAQMLALALQGEKDPGVVEAVALSVLPNQINTNEGSRLQDRLIIAANSERQRMVLTGHGNKAVYAAFSPDGARIITASLDKTARVWSATTGILLMTLRGHAEQVDSAVFSLDGTRILTASEDKTARIWDAASGKLLATLVGHTAPLYGASFSPDGKRVVTASGDKTARLWDAVSGKPLAILAGHSGDLSMASFSPDGSQVITASNDNTARLWDVATGKVLQTLLGHESYVETATFSPDGTRIVTASLDKTARVWDVASGKQLRVFPAQGQVTYAVFSPDGRRIAMAAANKVAQIWDVESGALIETLTGHRDALVSVAFSPDGKRLVTSSIDTTARVWDVSSSALISARGGHHDQVTVAVFSRDGKRIVTASMDKSALVWDAASGKILEHLTGHENGIVGAGFSLNGRRIVTASMDTTLRIWDAETGTALKVFARPGVEMHSGNFSPDGHFIAEASNDNLARVIDAETGATITILKGHGGWVRTGQFSRDQRRIVTASLDKTARIWDAATGTLLLTLSGHGSGVLDARFSPDGRRVVTASADGTARIWNAETGVSLHILVGHETGVRSAAFSPDGRRVLTGSSDGTARIWDATTGTPLMTLAAQGAGVYDAEFSPDGKLIITASADKLSRIWDSPEYLDAADYHFIRAISSRGLDTSLRAQYALGPAAAAVKAPAIAACRDEAAGVAAWTAGAAAGDGICHQRLAEHFELAPFDLGRAFFHHAVAARLLEGQGLEDAAQEERYRREALAWMLPRDQAGRLMVQAEGRQGK